MQELLISCRARIRRALREGRSYRGFLTRARIRERWTDEQLEAYQGANLRRLLQHAARSVPFYSSMFERLDLNPQTLELPGSMHLLPHLSRQDVIAAGDALIARGWRRGRVSGSTSGTTGTPLTIVQDLRAINRENAFIARQLAWAGFRPGDKRAWLRGDMVVPSDSTDVPYWRLNRVESMLMMSSYHLSESTANHYVSALADWDPKMVQAYPSSISFLARYLSAHNRFYRRSSLRAVITSSETLSAEDRRLVEERFRCKVYDWYGGFERVAAIGTCEAGTYHLLSDYSYAELEPSGDGLFEIIGTGFNNFVMPLIRYRTGDLVELPEQPVQCQCGRTFPVIKQIHGREDDYIKLSGGRRIGRMDHIFKGLTGIAEAQIVQDRLDAVRILVVPIGDFTDEKQNALLVNARQRLGRAAEVEIEIVASIPRTSSGKFRSVVCRI